VTRPLEYGHWTRLAWQLSKTAFCQKVAISDTICKPDPGSICRNISGILKINFAPVLLSKILRSISSKNSAYQARGGFHKTINALHLKLTLLHKCTPVWHHAFGPCTQLIAFSPRLGCTLRFMSCAQLLWNPSQYSIGLLSGPSQELKTIKRLNWSGSIHPCLM
jgi:hypothetical protein